MTAAEPGRRLRQGGEMDAQEQLAREVHAAWRDGMLRQRREVAPNRLDWATLSEEDQELDAYIARRMSALVLELCAGAVSGNQAGENDAEIKMQIRASVRRHSKMLSRL